MKQTKKTSNRIREERKNKKMNIDDLAKLIGVSRATINNYETGTHDPKLTTWKALSDIFGVDIGYLQGVSNIKKAEYNNNVVATMALHGLDTDKEKTEYSEFKNEDEAFIFNVLSEFYKKIYKDMIESRIKLSHEQQKAFKDYSIDGFENVTEDFKEYREEYLKNNKYLFDINESDVTILGKTVYIINELFNFINDDSLDKQAKHNLLEGIDNDISNERHKKYLEYSDYLNDDE